MAFASGFYRHLGKAAAVTAIAIASYAAVPDIKKDEGRSLTPYYDIAGILTDCDGNTVDVKPGRVRTHGECDEITKEAALENGQKIAEKLDVVIPQETFISHIRFRYNIGGGSYNASTTLRLTNAGDIAGGCEAMMKFVCYKPSKKEIARGAKIVTTPGERCYSKTLDRAVSKGLTARREREKNQCLKGLKDAAQNDHG